MEILFFVFIGLAVFGVLLGLIVSGLVMLIGAITVGGVFILRVIPYVFFLVLFCAIVNLLNGYPIILMIMIGLPVFILIYLALNMGVIKPEIIEKRHNINQMYENAEKRLLK